ncbi:hypothetical protein BC567DRAFT_236916 [Phyllosticta citribraziliensis]
MGRGKGEKDAIEIGRRSFVMILLALLKVVLCVLRISILHCCYRCRTLPFNERKEKAPASQPASQPKRQLLR